MKKLIAVMVALVMGFFAVNGVALADSDWLCLSCGEEVTTRVCKRCGIAEDDEFNDFMFVFIQDEVYFFELASTRMGGNKIKAEYKCYDPRGEVMYTMSLELDKYIREGNYVNATNAKDFQIGGTLGSAYSGSRADWLSLPGHGSYQLHLVSRSDDWRTYTGEFSARLINEVRHTSTDIDYAYFHFTLR